MTRYFPRSRFEEFRLASISAALALIGALAVHLAAVDRASVAWADIRHGALLAAAILGCTLFWMASRFTGDQLIFPVTALLAVLGCVIMESLQPALTRSDPNLSQVATRQLLYVIAGIALMAAVARFFTFWGLLRRYRYSLLLVCIGLLALTFFFGTTIGGAKLWISVGPVQVQPSEIIKIGLVLFLAAYLDEHRDLMDAAWRVGPLRLPPIPYLLPMILMWGASLVVLVVENDLGSALLLFGIFLAMVYVGTGRRFYVLAGLFTFAAACWFAFATFDRIGVRVQNWLDPWQDPLITGYQPIQSDFAIAAGGALGTGLGTGQAWRIPAVQTDYVFSALAEELGLLGTFAVLGLFGVLVARGFAVALRTNDGYLRLVALGLSAALGIQTIVILGGVLRLIPLTGITLPFVSYGGSSMLTNFVIVGLILNISACTRVQESR